MKKLNKPCLSDFCVWNGWVAASHDVTDSVNFQAIQQQYSIVYLYVEERWTVVELVDGAFKCEIMSPNTIEYLNYAVLNRVSEHEAYSAHWQNQIVINLNDNLRDDGREMNGTSEKRTLNRQLNGWQRYKNSIHASYRQQ